MPEIDPVILQLRADVMKYRVDVQQTADRVNRALDSQSQSMRRLESQIAASSNGIRSTMRALATSLASGFGVQQLINLTDGYTRFTNQLKVAGISGQNLAGVQDKLFGISQKYGVQLESVGTLYGRLAQSGKELGAGQSDLIRFTNGVAAALKIQGGAASESQGALLQLSQALGSPIVRAEEFNSINEGARPILQAVANGIDKYGGSVAKLRTDVIAGNVASRDFFQGFLKGSAQLEKQAAAANFTIGASFTILNNALGKYVGQTSDALSITERVSQGIVSLSNNLDTIIPALAGIAAGYTALKVGSAAFDATAAAAQRALAIDRETTAAILSGNASYVSRARMLQLQATAAREAAAVEVAGIEAAIAARKQEAIQLEQNLALIAQQRADALLAQKSLAAQSALGFGRIGVTRSSPDADRANRDLKTQIATRRALTAVNAEIAASETALAAAQARTAAATTAETAAVEANTVAKRAGAAMSALFAGTMSTLVAALPIIAIGALVAAVIHYSSAAKEAAFDSKEFAKQGEDLADHLAEASQYGRAAANAITNVGSQAASATGKMLSFANATGEAAQRLYDLAKARRTDLLEKLKVDETTARQEKEAASARYQAAGQSSTSQARFGNLPISSAQASAQEKANKEFLEAQKRETAASNERTRLLKTPLSGFLTGSEKEGGRDVEGELARVTRDLTVARERGIKAQVDSLEAEKFELTQYKKYRKQGLSPQAAQEASNRDKNDFQSASAGAQGDKDAKTAARDAKAAARKQATADAKAAREQASIDRGNYQLTMEELQARLSLSASAEDRAKIQQEMLDAERKQRVEEINADKTLSPTQRQAQLDRIATIYGAPSTDSGDITVQPGLLAKKINQDRQEQIDRDNLDRAQAAAQNEADLLRAQEGLTDSRTARRDIELKLLDLSYQQERNELEATIASATSTQAQKDIAKARLAMLGQLQASEAAGVNRDHESPLEQRRREVRETAANMGDAIENIEVDAVDRLADGLANASKEYIKLGGIAGDVINGIIADLVKLAVQQAVFGAIGGGSGGGGGGFFGGLVSGVTKLFRSSASTPTMTTIPGFATGTRSAPRGIAVVGERGREIIDFDGGERVYNNAETNAIMAANAASMSGVSAARAAPVQQTVVVKVEANDYFDARVDSRATRVATPIAAQHAKQAAGASYAAGQQSAPGTINKYNQLKG